MTLVVGLVLGTYFSWEITLIGLACSPLVFAGYIVMGRLQFNKKAENKANEADPYEKANALLSEVVMNYKTIQSFGENNIETLFVKY